MSGGFIAHGIAYLEMPPEYPGYFCTDTANPGQLVDCAPKTPKIIPDPLFPTFCDST